MSENKINNGGQAFPAQPVFRFDNEIGMEINIAEGGMTLRDYFAAKAMQGELANPTGDGVWDHDSKEDKMIENVKFYYRLADAMIKARE